MGIMSYNLPQSINKKTKEIGDYLWEIETEY